MKLFCFGMYIFCSETLTHCINVHPRHGNQYMIHPVNASISYEWVAALQLEQLEVIVQKVVGLYVMIYDARRHIWLITKALNGMCPECVTKTKMSLLHSCREFPEPLSIYGTSLGNDVDHDGYIHDAVSTAIEEMVLSPKLVEFLLAALRKVTVQEFSTFLERVKKRAFLPCRFYNGNAHLLFSTFAPSDGGELLASKLRDPSSQVVGYSQYRDRMKSAVEQFRKYELRIHIDNIRSVIRNLPRAALQVLPWKRSNNMWS